MRTTEEREDGLAGALKDAMSAHVHDVRAAPGMGATIRRRRRGHVVRFRMAAVVAATAVAAGAVPAYTVLTAGSAPATAPAAAGQGGQGEDDGAQDGTIIASPGAVVPQVVGLDVTAAKKALEDAGYQATFRKKIAPDAKPGTIIAQRPAAGTGAVPGATVESTIATREAARGKTGGADPEPSMKTLGDLGDGRAFGRVKVGYVPDGLTWSHWSVDLGDKYTTSWDDGNASHFYCVQIYAYQGDAVAETTRARQSYADKGEGEEVAVGDNGRTGYLVTRFEGEDDGPGTRTVFLTLDRDLAVEIMISPYYAKILGSEQAVDDQLQKIAAGLTAKSAS
jgi:hypothetical protein